MKKSKIIKGPQITFRVDADLHSFLAKQSNQSNFINDAIREKVHRSKSKVEMYKENQKEIRRLAKRINTLQENSEKITSQMSYEEIESLSHAAKSEFLKEESLEVLEDSK